MEEHKNIDIEDDKHIDNDIEITKEWNTCCSHSSINFIKYITTVSMSVIVLIFCIVRTMTIIGSNNPDKAKPRIPISQELETLAAVAAL